MSIPVIRFPAWILIVSLLAGCAPFESLTRGRPVREVYDDAGLRDPIALRSDSTPGSGPRTRPVIYPPKVFAVYVQEHLDLKRDLKIGGHWIYFKLRDSSWMPEDIDREPLSDGDAQEADVKLLRAELGGLDLTRVVIPYRSAQTPQTETPHEFRNE